MFTASKTSRYFLLAIVACHYFFVSACTVCLAAQSEEDNLIAALQSASASPREKDAACARLKVIGTARSVPALAALLTNADLSHSARYALESMPDAAASKALLQALPQTSGLLQVGIINSLAARNETAAVAPMTKLLMATNGPVAVAAAEALGRLGGPQALKALQTAAATSRNSLHSAEVDGILVCANHLLDGGQQADALKVFRAVYATEKTDRFRVAAFRGMILASGKHALPLVTEAIAHGDPPTQSAALRAAAQLNETGATQALVELLSNAELPVQMALLECLDQRDDPAALSDVARLANSSNPQVRLATLKTLGKLGDTTTVELLAEKAASGDNAEQSAARQSLSELHRGPVTEKMMALLKTASPGVEMELINALGARGDQVAVPALTGLAQNGNDAERAAALQALGQLADGDQIPRLVQMVAEARNDAPRSEIAETLVTVCQRLQSWGRKLDPDALVKAVQTGALPTRLALLPVFSGLVQEPARQALRGAMTDQDPQIRTAAVHALCESRDPELLPDLLALTGDKNETGVRHLAIRGTVRLITQDDNARIPNATKLAALNAILATPLDVSDKRLVLAALGAIPDSPALEAALHLLDDTSVQPEAEQAVIKIAAAISPAHPAEAGAALRRVLSVSTNPATRQAAQTALQKIK